MKMTTIFIICACILLLARLVQADGMFVSDYHRHLAEPGQKAIIAWDGKNESMILAAAARSSDVANFAWIVPIISRTQPIVSKADIVVFEHLVSCFMRDRLAVPDQGVMTALVSPVIARRLRRSNLQRITVPDKTRRLLRCARNDGLFLGFPLEVLGILSNAVHDPADVFSRLAEDPSQEVRWEVAVNPNCPAKVLESLASGGGSKMKLTIVYNPNLPLRILEDLTQDKDPLVAEVAETVLGYRTSHERIRVSQNDSYGNIFSPGKWTGTFLPVLQLSRH